MAILGLCLVVGAGVAYLAMLFVLKQFTYRTGLFHAVVLSGIGLAALGLIVGDPALPGWIAIALGGAWFVVIRREMTINGPDRLTIRPGDLLPKFAALRADGTEIGDRDVVARAPALLVLYRGWWCPSTKALLDEVRADHERLKAAGLTLFAASVDSPEQAAGMQEYVGPEITIVCSFPVAVLDAIGARDRRGAPWYDRLLIRAPAGEIAMPTALVVNASGRVAYAFRAQRVDERARPADILAALQSR